ncbi:hypothetical protein [Bacillus pumilus]|uniref:hypothetical protein n=1 Tax=Bacillus pumilus TaxID=1408 RepID=UPI0011A6465C|nr:hypothetical protein [Bacillus pumilus]
MDMDDLKEPKKLKNMVNAELLEVYSYFNKQGFHTIEEQNYIAHLRQEILKRMNAGNINKVKI